MMEYISKEEAINALGERPAFLTDSIYVLGSVGQYYHDRLAIESVPSADVKKNEHGYWIYHISDVFPADSTMECSVCHEHESVLLAHDNYCPNCGAKMDGEQNVHSK